LFETFVLLTHERGFLPNSIALREEEGKLAEGIKIAELRIDNRNIEDVNDNCTPQLVT
jgi:hypothetical protein